MNLLNRLFFQVISLPFFSRAWGRIVRLRHPGFLVRWGIGKFKKAYNINMDEFEGEPVDYPSLSEFFVRRLDASTRPLVPVEGMMASPADGMLTEIETVYEDRATQVKGKEYSISQLIQTPLDFSGGYHVMTVYLSPYNYHRFHYPVTGRALRFFHAGGRLFPVKTSSVDVVNNLYIRNERVITQFECGEHHWYMVAVGAAMVGGIRMEYFKEKMPPNTWTTVECDVKQLREMGRFEMGSTLVLVVPAKMAKPLDISGEIRVGDPIFQLT